MVAEQIGAQIFIDGLAMAAPGDPGWRPTSPSGAASVSHDGEAVHAAQVLAAHGGAGVRRAATWTRCSTPALGLIPADCLIARVIGDVRAWRATDDDWRRTRERIDERYGYDRYGGNCHVVPNHAL